MFLSLDGKELREESYVGGSIW